MNIHLVSNSVSNSYGTKKEILAGFGPVGNTEKTNLGRLWATFEGVFFMFTEEKNNSIFWKNIVESALKTT